MSHGSKGTANRGRHQALRRRVEILEARLDAAEDRADKVRKLEADADSLKDQRLEIAKQERAIRAEIRQLNKLGFEGV